MVLPLPQANGRRSRLRCLPSCPAIMLKRSPARILSFGTTEPRCPDADRQHVWSKRSDNCPAIGRRSQLNGRRSAAPNHARRLATNGERHASGSRVDAHACLSSARRRVVPDERTSGTEARPAFHSQFELKRRARFHHRRQQGHDRRYGPTYQGNPAQPVALDAGLRAGRAGGG
jgi:hypothetical protein